ncbi:hypothetical protein F2P81_001617 [Scophthalmus maximus]|uniref:Uncharacterized protein n=1 Tax=Scophthalmus maximus TaxID=52904 RepID=A0A6A4TKS3_SCOMX|nr:hypothetical protein F2P81_001617 [Scophthalmus maximus]
MMTRRDTRLRGETFSSSPFLLFRTGGRGIRGTCVSRPTGGFSGTMPGFIEPNLSGGYHIDDNQTAAAKQIKVIRANQRAPDSPLTPLLMRTDSRGPLSP